MFVVHVRLSVMEQPVCFSWLGSVVLTSRCVQRLQFEHALLALSGCCVVVSRLYFALHSSTEKEMHMKTTQINTEDG